MVIQMATKPVESKKWYSVGYDMNLWGTIDIEASSPEEAKRLVENEVKVNKLIRLAERGSEEITATDVTDVVRDL
jgi:hypothetical protein